MKPFRPLLFLVPLLGLALTGCGPLLPFRAPAAAPKPTASVVQTQAPTSTPVAEPAPTVETCERGQIPVFAYGFSTLKQLLGERMGEPLSCERFGPEGDSLQQTTTGMARYRKSTNVATFTTGNEHWAWTVRGLVHWKGAALDPPENAQLVEDGTDLASESTTEAAAATPVLAAVVPDPNRITLPTDPGPEILPGAPSWLHSALLLLREYDRRNATVLVPAIERAGVSVGNLGGADGAWGLFVPSSHRIVLDASLAKESPEAVAPVLGHEADHARDTFQYGPPRTEAACYTWEITAFALEARIWASMVGPAGKPDPSTDLEHELNLILETSHTHADTLIGAIKSNYQAECGV